MTGQKLSFFEVLIVIVVAILLLPGTAEAQQADVDDITLLVEADKSDVGSFGEVALTGKPMQLGLIGLSYNAGDTNPHQVWNVNVSDPGNSERLGRLPITTQSKVIQQIATYGDRLISFNEGDDNLWEIDPTDVPSSAAFQTTTLTSTAIRGGAARLDAQGDPMLLMLSQGQTSLVQMDITTGTSNLQLTRNLQSVVPGGLALKEAPTTVTAVGMANRKIFDIDVIVTGGTFRAGLLPTGANQIGAAEYFNDVLYLGNDDELWHLPTDNILTSAAKIADMPSGFGDWVGMAAGPSADMADLSTLTYVWTSSGGGSFDDSATRSSTWRAPIGGSSDQTITLTLTITDSNNDSISASVDVTLLSVPPTPTASAERIWTSDPPVVVDDFENGHLLLQVDPPGYTELSQVLINNETPWLSYSTPITDDDDETIYSLDVELTMAQLDRRFITYQVRSALYTTDMTLMAGGMTIPAGVWRFSAPSPLRVVQVEDLREELTVDPAVLTPQPADPRITGAIREIKRGLTGEEDPADIPQIELSMAAAAIASVFGALVYVLSAREHPAMAAAAGAIVAAAVWVVLGVLLFSLPGHIIIPSLLVPGAIMVLVLQKELS